MSRTVLVTGARGFVGKNLMVALKRREDLELLEYDIDNSEEDLESMTARADFVFHLAGVNRPKDPSEFETGNIGFTRKVCELLDKAGKKSPIVISSTIQAVLDNPYGKSKKGAEDAVRLYSRETGAAAHVFRLPNVFGKWGTPDYNSAVNTFCYNLARGLPIQVNAPDRVMELVYIDDIVETFCNLLDGRKVESDGELHCVKPQFEIRLGEIAALIEGFANSRDTLMIPNMDDSFVLRLYSSYISYLPADRFSYDLTKREDDRGALAEVLKSANMGQLFFSTTKPGVIRGNHYHDRKVEKFIVLSGEAIIRFEHILTGEMLDVPVSGGQMKVVDIPPGYTHHIENVGDTEMVVLFWANELFDQDAPDTYFKEVTRG